MSTSRPPTTSERLLRDTLLKHDRTRRHSHSNSIKDTQIEYTQASFLFRTPLTPHAPPSSGPPSPSHSQHRGEPVPLTPHEEVLRARLERVLSAGRQESREREREERRRSVDKGERRRSGGHGQLNVNLVDGGWPWKDSSPVSTLTRSHIYVLTIHVDDLKPTVPDLLSIPTGVRSSHALPLTQQDLRVLAPVHPVDPATCIPTTQSYPPTSAYTRPPRVRQA